MLESDSAASRDLRPSRELVDASSVAARTPMPAGAGRTRSGTSSRGYPTRAPTWSTRDRHWGSHQEAPLADMLSLPEQSSVPAVALAAPPVVSENPVAGMIVGADGILLPASASEPNAPSAMQLPRGHPFTLKPLKKWWVDDAGGARPLVAIGGVIVQAGLCSLYYDVALLASTVGAMCVIFGGLSAEMALRSTLPQRGRRLRPQALGPKERKRQILQRCAMWLSICMFTWYTHKAASASIEWCPASMYSNNSTLGQRWRGPVLHRVQCSTTAGALDILLWPEWSPLGVAHFLELVRSGFYSDVAFYHAAGPMKLVEFGVSGDKKVQRHWDGRPVADDLPPRDLPRFEEGTLGYATTQRNARTTQVFFAGFNFDSKAGDSPSMYLSLPSETAEHQRAVDQILPIGRVSSSSEESVMTLRALFNHWQAMRPRDQPVPPALSTLEQHVRTDGNSYVRRELPGVDFVESCQLAGAPEAQCGTAVLRSSAEAFLALLVCLSLLDLDGPARHNEPVQRA